MNVEAGEREKVRGRAHVNRDIGIEPRERRLELPARRLAEEQRADAVQAVFNEALDHAPRFSDEQSASPQQLGLGHVAIFGDTWIPGFIQPDERHGEP